MTENISVNYTRIFTFAQCYTKIIFCFELGIRIQSTSHPPIPCAKRPNTNPSTTPSLTDYCPV
jgi:hypothetical protein